MNKMLELAITDTFMTLKSGKEKLKYIYIYINYFVSIEPKTSKI